MDSMKKIVLLLLILAATTAVAGTIWLVRLSDQVDSGAGPAMDSAQTSLESSTTSFLPADAVAMIRFSDLGQGLELLERSPLGRSLAGIDIPKVMRAMGASEQEVSRVRQVMNSGEWRIWKKLLVNLFGQETLIGYVPDRKQGPASSSGPEFIFAEGLVAVCRPEQGAALWSLVSSFIPGLEQKQVRAFQGQSIRELVLDQDLNLYHCSIDGYLLLSMEPGSLVRLLKVRNGQVPSLVQVERFRQEWNRVSGDLALAFVNGKGLQTLLNDLQKANGAHQASEAGLPGFRSAVFGWARSGPGLFEQTGTIDLIPERLTPAQRTFLGSKPEDPRPFLGMAPRGTNLLIWQGNFDPAALWPGSGQPDSDLDSQMQDVFGRDWERFKSRLDGQAGTLFRDMASTAMFPVPEWAFFLQAKNQDRLMSAMVRSVLQQVHQATGLDLPVRRVKEQGLELEQVVLPFGEALRPSWARIGEYEVWATNQGLLEDIWAVSSGGECLAAETRFSEVGTPLVQPGHGFQFIQVDACLEMLRTALVWAGDMALATRLQGERAARLKVIRDELMHPVLDGLQMFETAALWTIMNPERLNVKGLLSTVTLELGPE